MWKNRSAMLHFFYISMLFARIIKALLKYRIVLYKENLGERLRSETKFMSIGYGVWGQLSIVNVAGCIRRVLRVNIWVTLGLLHNAYLILYALKIDNSLV